MSTVRKVPLRKCIGCNEMKNKKEMIRVVKTTGHNRKNERTRCLCLLSGMSGESNEKQRTFPFSEGRNSIRGL